MTSTVKRSVPPPALVKTSNPLVRMLLGSPLHGVLDDSFLVLHLTGRRTGRRYDIPVGYVDMVGKLAVVSVATWRVNLRGGADVEVMLRGHLRPMHALLDEDPASVAASYQAMINRLPDLGTRSAGAIPGYPAIAGAEAGIGRPPRVVCYQNGQLPARARRSGTSLRAAR